MIDRHNLERQLEYLKYQVNPHFFMNTLNNIHALVDISPEKAKESIAIVGFAQSWGVAVEHLLIIPRLLESETAVSGYDRFERVCKNVGGRKVVQEGRVFKFDRSRSHDITESYVHRHDLCDCVH